MEWVQDSYGVWTLWDNSVDGPPSRVSMLGPGEEPPADGYRREYNPVFNGLPLTIGGGGGGGVNAQIDEMLAALGKVGNGGSGGLAGRAEFPSLDMSGGFADWLRQMLDWLVQRIKDALGVQAASWMVIAGVLLLVFLLLRGRDGKK